MALLSSLSFSLVKFVVFEIASSLLVALMTVSNSVNCDLYQHKLRRDNDTVI